jgi:hypothetical protein
VDVAVGSKCEILRLIFRVSPESGLSALGGFRQSGNGPSRRHASPADAPRNPHKQPNNLTAMVGMIGSISSDAALAENVGLCWHRWHLAIGSGRNAATMD